MHSEYSRYTTEYLLERRAIGDELSIEAHQAIERVLAERGETWRLQSSGAQRSPQHGSAPSWPTNLSGLAKDSFFRASIPLWRYCLIAGLWALVPSAALSGFAVASLKAMGLFPQVPTFNVVEPAWILLTVVVAPVVETVLLAGSIWLFSRRLLSPLHIAAASALLWGSVHALLVPIWFFGTVWSFFVFTAAYLAWRPRSKLHAFTATAVPHVFVNLVAVVLMRAGF